MPRALTQHFRLEELEGGGLCFAGEASWLTAQQLSCWHCVAGGAKAVRRKVHERQEEERERRDNYVPEVSQLTPTDDGIAVDNETREMLREMVRLLSRLRLFGKILGCAFRSFGTFFCVLLVHNIG